MEVIDFSFSTSSDATNEQRYKAIGDVLQKEVKEKTQKPAVIFFQEGFSDILLEVIDYLMCNRNFRTMKKATKELVKEIRPFDENYKMYHHYKVI